MISLKCRIYNNKKVMHKERKTKRKPDNKQKGGEQRGRRGWERESNTWKRTETRLYVVGAQWSIQIPNSSVVLLKGIYCY